MEAEPVLLIASPPAAAFDCQRHSDVARHVSLSDYWALTKPEVNFLIVLATFTGFYLGYPGPLDQFALWRLLHTLLGTLLVASGTGALNQYIERDFDVLMRRTRRRPLTSGRLEPSRALWFGIVLSVAGVAYLTVAANLLAGELAAFTLLSYLFLYTPLKRKTPICVPIGALPGAVPPLIGYAAASGKLSMEAWVLYLILFLWQFPHFMAIAWMYREDYERAGYLVLPQKRTTRLRLVALQTVLPLVALIPVSLAPVRLARSGTIPALAASTLAVVFLYFGTEFVRSKSGKAARRLLFASILYLPAILIVDANALRAMVPYRAPSRVYLNSPSSFRHIVLRRFVHSLFGTLPARLLLCGILLVGLQSISTRGQSHVAEPAVNLGDTSFLDAPAGPGFVAEQIGDAAHDGTITDSAGNAVPDASAVNSISGLTHIAWLGHKRVLGGWYGVEIVLSAAHVNAGTTGDAGGLGATTVSPFILQWPERRFLGMAIDQRADVDFDLPTGQYSRTSSVNIRSNDFTVHPYYSITAFPRKRIETSWRVHYVWNSVNNDPPVSADAQSTQAGQLIHLNATAAYSFHRGLWIGANGYYLKQITDGKIDGVALHNSPERVGAIGPGMVWNHGSWFFYANGYQEFAAQNRATGHKLVLRIEKTF
jgi:protoheme IX farnesyltransferase